MTCSSQKSPSRSHNPTPAFRACCAERAARTEYRRSGLPASSHSLLPGGPFPSRALISDPLVPLSLPTAARLATLYPWRCQRLSLTFHVLTQTATAISQGPLKSQRLPPSEPPLPHFLPKRTGPILVSPTAVIDTGSHALRLLSCELHVLLSLPVLSWSFLSGTDFLSHPQIRTFQ